MARVRKFKAPKVTTVVGAGTEISGDIEFRAGLHVDGKIRGNVFGEPESNSTLMVTGQGEVEGDVRVDNLILNGTVIGDVYANGRVELAPKARVTGTVYYRLLEMAMGAEVNGQLVHSEDLEQRSASHDSKAAKGAENDADIEIVPVQEADHNS